MRTILTLAALTLVYFVAGKLGLKLAFVNASASAVWPPTGIAIGALLILGSNVWPAVLVGAFLVNITTAGSVISSAGIAAGNTLEAIAAAYLVTHFAAGRNAFRRAPNVFRFVALAGICAPAVSATIGVISLALTGYANWNDFATIWFTWWLGDALGAIAVAPLIVLWCQRSGVEWRPLKIAEAVLLVASVSLVGMLVFPLYGAPYESGYPLQFLYLPLLVWASFRFSPREAATATILLSGFAVWSTVRATGPFVLPSRSENESLLLVQLFMGTLSTVTLGMAALVWERREIRAALQRANISLEADVRERTSQLSEALQSVRSMSSQLIHVRDDEQRRISRELHDGIGQEFVAVLLGLSAVEKRLQGNDPTAAAAIQETSEVAQRCLEAVRTLSYLLHPPLLEEQGLGFAAAWYVAGLKKRTGLEITLERDASLPRLPIETETAAFRIIQESLTNVHRHSNSPVATVRITLSPKHLVIEISDAGIGLPAAVARGEQGGIGLTSMRERAQDLGGRLEVDSSAHGTTVRAWLPSPAVNSDAPAGQQIRSSAAGQ